MVSLGICSRVDIHRKKSKGLNKLSLLIRPNFIGVKLPYEPSCPTVGSWLVVRLVGLVFCSEGTFNSPIWTLFCMHIIWYSCKSIEPSIFNILTPKPRKFCLWCYGCQGCQLFMQPRSQNNSFIQCLMLRKFCLFVKLFFSVIIFSLITSIVPK